MKHQRRLSRRVFDHDSTKKTQETYLYTVYMYHDPGVTHVTFPPLKSGDIYAFIIPKPTFCSSLKSA